MSTFELERGPAVPEQPTDLAKPPRKAARSLQPLMLRLHFYAGVLIAPFILIAAVTGGLYAMAPTIDRFVYADLTHVRADGPELPLTTQVENAAAAYPDLTLSGVRPPETSEESTRVYFADPELTGDKQRAVFVDPYSGEVLGTEPVWFGYLPLSTWLDDFHRNLQLGEPGRVYSEMAASWMWVVALGGLYLWFVKARKDRAREKKPRFFTIDRSATGRARTLNWHGVAGIWIVLGLLFLSATGLTWSKYAGENVTELRTEMSWERPSLDTEPAASGHEGHGGSHEHGAQAQQIDYDKIRDTAARSGVTVPMEITLPTEPGGAVSVAEIEKAYRVAQDSVAIDPATNDVTSKLDYWRDYTVVAMLADLGIRMHMGFLFGFLNQLLLLVVVGLLTTVIVRGYLMWWRRRPTRGSAWAVGRPPARGGVRRMHPAFAVGLGAAALAVGWFFPLLGLSLLAFLVVDLLIGAGKRIRARA
ncbi:PepSY domain-containing protein [Antrihabitans sp. YC2-6]|uniref:PepSY-associated TM helix domain-containing protein n=1 Tax=Antrihabitans sp. YC2-6 TaxID=2799498 RepID=UPI0018F37911|nr:PepSY domain-containing protein [Antrihabitans sp. YC2-6]MBJ8345621.1 PepSY domain-containing protein [Antrihabitans sp. YC2-6]